MASQQSEDAPVANEIAQDSDSANTAAQPVDLSRKRARSGDLEHSNGDDPTGLPVNADVGAQPAEKKTRTGDGGGGGGAEDQDLVGDNGTGAVDDANGAAAENDAAAMILGSDMSADSSDIGDDDDISELESEGEIVELVENADLAVNAVDGNQLPAALAAGQEQDGNHPAVPPPPAVADPNVSTGRLVPDNADAAAAADTTARNGVFIYGRGTIVGMHLTSYSIMVDNLSAAANNRDPSEQLAATTAICQVLAIHQDQIGQEFPSAQVAQLLCKLMRKSDNINVLQQVCSALTYLLDFLPISAENIAADVEAIIIKLQSPEYIDFVEQCIRTLDLLSDTHPRAILLQDGVTAIFQLIDFVSLPVQRSILSLTAKCCYTVVNVEQYCLANVLPQLMARLICSDKASIDVVASTLCSLVGNLSSSDSLLQDFVANGLISFSLQLLMNSTSSAVSSSAIISVTTTLATLCHSSKTLAIELFRLGIVDVIFNLLVGENRSDAAPLQRPEEEIASILSLINNLLPADDISNSSSTVSTHLATLDESTPGDILWQWLNRSKIWRSYMPAECSKIEAAHRTHQASLELTGGTAKNWRGNKLTVLLDNMQHVSKPQNVIRSIRRINMTSSKLFPGGSPYPADVDLSFQFVYMANALLPAMINVLESSAGGKEVRSRSLVAMLSMLRHVDLGCAESAAWIPKLSSVLARLLASSDITVQALSIQVCHVITSKQQEVFTPTFLREGVVHQIARLSEEHRSNCNAQDVNNNSTVASTVSSTDHLLSADSSSSSVEVDMDEDSSSVKSIEVVKQWIEENARLYVDSYVRDRVAGSEVLVKLTRVTETLKAAPSVACGEVEGALAELASLLVTGDPSSFEIVHSGVINALLEWLEMNNNGQLSDERAVQFARVFNTSTNGSVCTCTQLMKKLIQCLEYSENFRLQMFDPPLAVSGGPHNLVRYFQEQTISCRFTYLQQKIKGENNPAAAAATAAADAAALLQPPAPDAPPDLITDAAPAAAQAPEMDVAAQPTAAQAPEMDAAAQSTAAAATQTQEMDVAAQSAAAGGVAVDDAPVVEDQALAPQAQEAETVQAAQQTAAAAAPTSLAQQMMAAAERLLVLQTSPTSPEVAAEQQQVTQELAAVLVEVSGVMNATEPEVAAQNQDVVDRIAVQVERINNQLNMLYAPAPGKRTIISINPVYTIGQISDALSASASGRFLSEWPADQSPGRTITQARNRKESVNKENQVEKILLGGHVLPRDMTLFDAVVRYSPTLKHIRNVGNDALNFNYQDDAIWSKKHDFQCLYRDVSAVDGVEKSPADVEQQQQQQQLHQQQPAAQAPDRITNILRLLELCNKIRYRTDPAAALAVECRGDLISSKLTTKVNQMSTDTIAVMVGRLNDWPTTVASKCPFLLPFQTRLALFNMTSFGVNRGVQYLFTSAGRELTDNGNNITENVLENYLGHGKMVVSRDNLLGQAEIYLPAVGQQRFILEVLYKDEIGSGIGPTLEFYSLVSKDLQRHGLGLWRGEDHKLTTDPVQYLSTVRGLYPAPYKQDDVSDQLLRRYSFVGVFLARAVMDSRLVDLPLSVVAYKWLIGNSSEISHTDLSEVDPVLAHSLDRLRSVYNHYAVVRSAASGSCTSPEYEAKVADQLTIDGIRICDLGLTFVLPGYPNIELKPTGRDTGVTLDNVGEFIELVTDWTLKTGVSKQMEAMCEGFNSVFATSRLTAFMPHELDQLFCGNSVEPWSIQYLSACCRFDHGYTVECRVVTWLFEILAAFKPDEQRQFILFATGSTRLPIGGLRGLSPPLTVVRRAVESYEVADQFLPSVMTCANYIKLPDYSSKEILYERLQLAIAEGQGSFHFS